MYKTSKSISHLKEEFRVLAEKERSLKERENMLIAAKINWDKTIEVEVQQKIHSFEQVSNVAMVSKRRRPNPLSK